MAHGHHEVEPRDLQQNMWHENAAKYLDNGPECDLARHIAGMALYLGNDIYSNEWYKVLQVLNSVGNVDDHIESTNDLPGHT